MFLPPHLHPGLVAKCFYCTYSSLPSKMPELRELAIDNKSQPTGATETWLNLKVLNSEETILRLSAFVCCLARGHAGEVLNHSNPLHPPWSETSRFLNKSAVFSLRFLSISWAPLFGEMCRSPTKNNQDCPLLPNVPNTLTCQERLNHAITDVFNASNVD